jgi:hypothetical protein
VKVGLGGELPQFPPQSPHSTSGGQMVAAWRSGKNLMCILVVKDENVYRRLIRTTQSPLA